MTYIIIIIVMNINAKLC